MGHSSFVGDLALVLGVAALTGVLFRFLKQPSILGYLFAGLIVGPYIPVPLFADPDRVHALSEFGVVLVMFAVGLEFRLEKFLKVLPISGVTGLVEIGALMSVGYLLGQWLGWSEVQSMFLGACICISSTMAVTKILEQQPIEEDSRRLVYGVLVLQDVAAIALIAVMTAIGAGSGASFSGVLGILGKLLAVLFLMVACGMFVVPRAIKQLVKTKNSETLVVGAVGVCFCFAVLAEGLGYSAALGAFIGGILVAESGHGLKVEHATSAVRDMFSAVFFVSIGMTVDPRIAFEQFPTALAVLACVIVAQFFSVTLGGILSGSGIRRSATAGLTLGQIGEFAFIIGAIGTTASVVSPEFQPVLVTVAVLSTFTTALCLRARERITYGFDRALPATLRRLLGLYETWVDELRTRPPDPNRRVGRVLRSIFIDCLMMAGVVLAWRAWEKEIGAGLVQAFGLGDGLKQTVTALTLTLALLPLLIPLVLSARKLSRVLAGRVFGEEDQSSARALLQATLLLLMVAAVGIPATLLVGPLVGAAYVWPAFALALGIAAALAWKKATALDQDIQSGGALMLRTIAKQGLPDDEAEHTPSLLGLNNLHETLLSEGDYAVGKTLAEVKLRSLTGGNAVALRKAAGAIGLPTGAEALELQDAVLIAGCQQDQIAADTLLRLGPEALQEAQRASNAPELDVSGPEPGSSVEPPSLS